MPIERQDKRRPYRRYLVTGFLAGMALIVLSGQFIAYTSTDSFCMSCHVHPHAEDNWRLSTHYDNPSGIVVHCVQCHLPPPGTLGHLTAKAVTGARDVYGMLFKDTDAIDWEAKRQLEQAVRHTYEASCIACHQNLFPLQLSEEGLHAHLYYTDRQDELNCLNCHLHVGHYSEVAQQTIDFGLGQLEQATTVIYQEAARVEGFERFTETIPGTGVSFDMLPIPGGRFQIGSPAGEPGRGPDEGPLREVELGPFFLAEVEVTWDMYMAFFRETVSEGRTEAGSYVGTGPRADGVDAISGPTPPWGSPDQGWGWGDRPAITMTYHAAETFCRWLGMKTGKDYRLPTEAEWEYAARGGTSSPYFFEGDPRRFTRESLRNRLFGADTTTIGTYVVYRGNSASRTQPPGRVKANPFGLKNMLGNVWEFCSDFYAPETYAHYPEGSPVRNPQGPPSGTERVIRGGSFRSDAYQVRTASRSHTRHDDWLITDPQIPKSIWWYSDNNEVGFRLAISWPMDSTKQ